ncbi:MAG: phospholipase D-like domain-containing protein, partial [Nitrospira sp.]
MIRPSPFQLSTQYRRVYITGLLIAVLLGPSVEVSATSVEVWYGPEDRPLEHLVQMYDRAKRYIFVAVYGVTSPLTVKALVQAKRRGVDVRLLTDRTRLTDPKQRTALSA